MLVFERLGSSLLERDGVLASTNTLPLPGMCVLKFVYQYHGLHLKKSNNQMPKL